MTTKTRGLRLTGAMMLLALLGLTFALVSPAAASALPAGTLDPATIPKYQEPLVIPPAMPLSGTKTVKGKKIDYYEISVRQFQQFILPQAWSASMGIGPTTVWSYASMTNPLPVAQGGTLNYPALTVEARYKRAVRVKWINGLVDANGDYLPHLLAIDQTLHWANPAGGPGGTDTHGHTAEAYTGPVPIVTHLHGAHTTQDSDGFPEAWYLPNARNIPSGYATGGSYYQQFKKEFQARWGVKWQPGTAIFQYPNDQRATTLWYHDHTLGMTRVNVYAGPAGFYLLRGGPDDLSGARLPRPAPQRGDSPGRTYREIPIAIQDRTFQADGSLYYPDNRAFFEGLNVPGKTPSSPARASCASPSSQTWSPTACTATSRPSGTRDLRQHHRGQRQDLAVPERRAESLPAAPAERQPSSLPHPEDEQRHALLADRLRRGASCPTPCGSPNCSSPQPNAPT